MEDLFSLFEKPKPSEQRKESLSGADTDSVGAALPSVAGTAL